MKIKKVNTPEQEAARMEKNRIQRETRARNFEKAKAEYSYVFDLTANELNSRISHLVDEIAKCDDMIRRCEGSMADINKKMEPYEKELAGIRVLTIGY